MAEPVAVSRIPLTHPTAPVTRPQRLAHDRPIRAFDYRERSVLQARCSCGETWEVQAGRRSGHRRFRRPLDEIGYHCEYLGHAVAVATIKLQWYNVERLGTTIALAILSVLDSHAAPG